MVDVKLLNIYVCAITRDKPGLSRKSRLYDGKHGISTAKPGFPPQSQGFLEIYQVFLIDAFKTYPFCGSFNYAFFSTLCVILQF